ncbi:MAG: DUF6010 family protein [Ferruginibacter sp.]
MNAAIIGISSGILTIVIIAILKMLDKQAMYALILSGIGFLYVGFTWTDIPTLIVTSIQAILFLLVAYFGIKKNLYFLAAGYFLHGLWDIAYVQFHGSNLIPPHYDIFCLSIDFTIGLYLVLLKYRLTNKNVIG